MSCQPCPLVGDTGKDLHNLRHIFICLNCQVKDVAQLTACTGFQYRSARKGPKFDLIVEKPSNI